MRIRRRSTALAAALTATALAGSGLAAAPASAAPNPNSGEKMARAVSTDTAMQHLNQFQAIADANGGNRAAGTPGYEASAQYVEKTLAAAGYTTTRQYFDFIFEQVNATSLDEVSPTARSVEHTPMSYSPSTGPAGVTAELVAPAVATGCDASEWGGVDATGKIALISRGTCSFGQKSAAAKAAGASAAIIYNNTDGALNGTLGAPGDNYVPTTGVTQAEGQTLVAKMASGPVVMKFVLDKVVEERQTFNIFAETKTGRTDNVVVLGAHLDGAYEGPGMSDNASGAATQLETAVQLGRANKVNNKVRFAWWGAEELGLLGATYYVNDLVENNPAELQNIAGYLNYDMVGSPNYIIGVYDANQSTYEAPVPVPEGSAALEKIFTDRFDAIQQPWVDTEFSGRSDYQPFIENGIPSSGLFTGADGTKTAEEVEMFGGTEGILYDPNYHTAQDDINNISREAIDINLKAMAYAAGTLAYDTSMVNGKASNGKSGKPKKVRPGTPMGKAAS
ncbi:M20/M25/M40 family metallo-hydrolase [Enemella evansiae]|uniref:Peptidase M28 n=1 Tax=Enemella evansiae TaxID=2016499 RepID=A0A255GB88_9ACTN|nr:M20/M25/M40 family metallo-hydrolase [Enemella evansiae]PFG65317.1 Zn-dependent M28 family amino/carboxypeptidase [Propionibacteriaceae bacterium ES.041]OYN97419.1 peptidase M28 [Enemella evansiae]OYN98497.1 peptidase M28 [Enemella evansiae]OYN99864.1 peptidase M28 [Enemella evansiae]OYO11195.1 peptidase M28 [Enemella evansiae]